MSRSQNITSVRDARFHRLVVGYWRRHGRHDLPWRKTDDPYRILVSEIMLQQTQVDRVNPKYREFLRTFPSFRVLARAPVSRVIKAWQGLGYNRRALMLQRCACAVMDSHGGALPDQRGLLEDLPGIGPYTAGAVMAFVFNKPAPIVETNIRRAYLHHYFPGRKNVPDKALLPIIERTLDTRRPRQWFWALMDYGAYLATSIPNPNRRSRHYVRQSKFQGSDRQIRGEVLRELLAHSRMVSSKIAKAIDRPPDRVKKILPILEHEGFIVRCTHAWCVHNPHWSLRQ